MKSLLTRNASSARLLPAELLELERQGRFRECMDAFAERWPEAVSDPDITGLSDHDAAEFLLRCGAVYGFYGHHEKISGSQLVSRDLLTAAEMRFLALDDEVKLAECENYLGLSYWRSGETNEGMSMVETALSRTISETSDTRLYSVIIRSLLRLTQRGFVAIKADFDRYEEIFLDHADNFLKGTLYNNFGIALKNTGEPRKALAALEIGRDYYNRSGNLIHFAVAENNLAQLYKTEGRFPAAHDAIDRATRLFKKAKDNARAAYSLDTKALVFYAELKFAEALAAAGGAVEQLRESENAAYLCDSLVTRSKIHLQLNDFSASVLDLSEAVTLCRQQSGDEAAKKYIAEFEQELESVRSGRSARKPEASADINDLRLVMPPSLSHIDDVKGVWIRNPHLESRGLLPGMLAIVGAGAVKKGDLVAVATVETNEISCGVYDFDFGIVCLESDDEPQLFNSDEITLLGKIVGVCDPTKNGTDDLLVAPLDLN